MVNIVLMPFRLAGILRAISFGLETLADTLTICADILEQLGLSQDVDTFLWFILLLCLVTRRFQLFFSIVVFVTVSSPIWRGGAQGSK